MLIRFDETGSKQGLALLLDEMTSRDTVTVMMVLACGGNEFLPEQIDPLLLQAKLPLFGGIFPSILFGDAKYDKGTIVVGFEQPAQVAVIHGLNDEKPDFKPQLFGIVSQVKPQDAFVMFVDGYSAHIDQFLSDFGELDPGYECFIGGGTGSTQPFANEGDAPPSIFTNQGLQKECAIVAKIALHCGIGVRHGFEPVEGPFRVTTRNGNILVSLDGAPALEVYQNIVSQYSHRKVTRQNLPDFFKAYPLGLISNKTTFLIRDLLALHGEELVTVSPITNGEFVYLVTGDKKALIGAAIEADKEAQLRFGNHDTGLTMLVECVSRALFLEEDLVRELATIGQKDRPVIGFFSLGEIAKYKENPVGYYNKTCIVGILGELEPAQPGS